MLPLLILRFLTSAIGQSTETSSYPPKEFMTSMADRMELLLLDRELISNLVLYAEKLQEKVDVLQRCAKAMRIPLETSKGKEEYLSNPLHSFQLIRHMHEDWRHLEKFMRQPVGQALAEHSERLLTLYRNTRHVPVSWELMPFLPEEFNQICRSSHQNKPSRLHCRYNTTTTPFLRLAPLRMEELSLDPYIVVYHNVLSDAEIAEVERVTEPLLKRSVVFDGKENKMSTSKKRTALGAWLPDYNMEVSGWPVIQRIFRRIHDMTGLIINDHQTMQLIKYGYGGHYDIHFDYFNASIPSIHAMGDRIATVLFYSCPAGYTS
ncbi:prolyl 4-hydroxylase subunit alpha-1-like [Drosophila persimilis]|uniref:prolyl 4-hydroxylase subunit alpha-1-like n=1 Tax=Drosophila persimilis TaxID=7234 RepID=UPI000F07B6A8|nr:prolyl 4-hydroxylase subunit alpha-1-like [Drosophila persimilis]